MAISQQVPGGTYAAAAAVDLSAKLNYFAKIDTSGNIDLAGDGTTVLGTIIEAAAETYGVSVQFAGIGKVIAAETIAIGARIASDSAGKAVNAAVGDYEVGTAISGADAGENLSFVFAPGRRHA